MHFMHEDDILHRDLKPDNITVTVMGEIKVIDFGLSRKIASRMSPNKGSEFYRVLEVNSCGTNNVVYDTKADVFSISYIFYELLNGFLLLCEVAIRLFYFLSLIMKMKTTNRIMIMQKTSKTLKMKKRMR